MEKMLGVMLDCSRNAVLKVETVKKYADIIKKMGYNTLMIYTEDTYEVDGHPFFGHLRGRYSKEELKEMDAYCCSIGLELVPCIQTLAHLNTLLKWASVYHEITDCDDILLAEEEDTYKLIDAMLSTISECFTSKKIHIGMDEAKNVGLGKYQIKHGLKDRFDIINNHLHKVCELTDKYGLEPMIWSDMFCALALNIADQYDEGDSSKVLEKAALPENVSLFYWDYYSTDYDRYAKNLKTNKLFGRKVYFAGGAWTWQGFAPNNYRSMTTTEVALKACNDIGVDGMIFTVWGDDGAECSTFTVLPSLMYAAETAKGNTDLDSIKSKFKDITGCDFDSFVMLDKFDALGGNHSRNPSKYLFYNDLFMGIRDYCCSPEDTDYYKKLAQEVHSADGKGEYGYIFDAYEKLAEVLVIKCNLGIKTRNAYLKKDMQTLGEVVKDCEVLMGKIKEFHKLHQLRWFKENKPHGFDVQDIRIGGVLQRLLSCKERLEQFIAGEITEIPELDEPVLDHLNGFNHWSRVVTPNVISHVM